MENKTPEFRDYYDSLSEAEREILRKELTRMFRRAEQTVYKWLQRGVPQRFWLEIANRLQKPTKELFPQYTDFLLNSKNKNDHGNI